MYSSAVLFVSLKQSSMCLPQRQFNCENIFQRERVILLCAQAANAGLTSCLEFIGLLQNAKREEFVRYLLTIACEEQMQLSIVAVVALRLLVSGNKRCCSALESSWRL